MTCVRPAVILLNVTHTPICCPVASGGTFFHSFHHRLKSLWLHSRAWSPQNLICSASPFSSLILSLSLSLSLRSAAQLGDGGAAASLPGWSAPYVTWHGSSASRYHQEAAGTSGSGSVGSSSGNGGAGDWLRLDLVPTSLGLAPRARRSTPSRT